MIYYITKLLQQQKRLSPRSTIDKWLLALCDEVPLNATRFKKKITAKADGLATPPRQVSSPVVSLTQLGPVDFSDLRLDIDRPYRCRQHRYDRLLRL